MDNTSEWHREVAVATFNRTWDLLDKPSRTMDEDAELMTAAFASLHHWTLAGTAENVAIGENQVARCAAAVGHASVAVTFASRALTRAEREGWTDWRLASALEVSARAYAEAGNAGLRNEFVRRATVVLGTLADADERGIVEEQLRTVPEAG